MVEVKITDYQRQKLETAIYNSFPDEVNLEMILRNNYEIIKIKSLNDVVGNEKYPFKIHKLVVEILSIDTLNEFFEVAIENHQKTELADFKKYYDSYYEYKFDILISGLNQIKKQPYFVNRFRDSSYLSKNNDVFKIWEKNKNTIPIDEIVYLLLASFNHQSDLSRASDERRLKIEDFAQSFLDRGGINIIEDNNYVDQWLNYNKINIPKLNKSISKNANLHIFITIEPLAAVKGKEKKITLKAGLYQLNHGKYENLENLENKECSLKQVPQEIYNSIEKVKKNNDKYIDLLTIELFVTYELLDEISQPSKYTTTDKQNLLYIKENNFVIRSLDRVKNPDFIRPLKQKWEKLQGGGMIEDITKLVISQESMKEIEDCINCLEYNDDDRQLVGLKICSNELPNGLPKAKKDKERLFKHMFRRAIPICIWIKIKDNLDITEMVEIDTRIDSLEEGINNLFNKIKKLRAQHRDRLIIGILYDHPYRIPVWLENIVESNYSNSQN